MMDLVDSEEDGHQQRHKIAMRQGIPLDFMDHILAKLRASDLIISIRGRTGGFQLKREPKDITLWDIFSAVEDSVYPVRCMGGEKKCAAEDFCISHDAWTEVYQVIRETFKQQDLASIVEKWQQKKSHLHEIPTEYSKPAECKGPVRLK